MQDRIIYAIFKYICIFLVAKQLIGNLIKYQLINAYFLQYSDLSCIENTS